MRQGYFCGAPGILVSALVWLAAALVAVFVSGRASVLALLAGGAVIHPVSVLVARLLGRSGKHTPGNPLGRLAIEGTFWLLAGIAIAYGLRVYWICGAALCVGGLALALLRAPAPISAFTGAVIELGFAAFVFMRPPPPPPRHEAA